MEEYENHSSAINIRNQINLNVNTFDFPHVINTFDFPHATAEEINKIIKIINQEKATICDKIPPKIIKLSANIIDSHFTNIINKYIVNERKEREKFEDYRPVSILNFFSKIHEK